MRVLALILTTAILAGVTTVSSRAQGDATPVQVRVTADRLNVREGPGTDEAVVGSVTQGQVLSVVEERADWIKVQLDGGGTGWVSRRFVESLPGKLEVPATPPEKPAEPPQRTPEGTSMAREGNGGSWLGSALKWGCLLGAGATGILAYSEHNSGNDSYDGYKDLVLRQGMSPEDAEYKRQEAKDHDSNATTYGIVAGGLFGAFLLQQFVLNGNDDQAQLPRQSTPSFAWDPDRGQWRARFLRAAF